MEGPRGHEHEKCLQIPVRRIYMAELSSSFEKRF